MKVLLTGGTGFVGRAVLNALVQEGHQVRLLARKPGSAEIRPLASSSVEVIAGDILNPASLGPAAQGAQAIIHLVGIISEAGKITFEKIHAEGTRNVVQAAQAGGVRRFVHMSALGTRAGAVSRYHQTKWEAEEIVRNSGLDYTIFRPSLIFGPEDQFVNLFEKISRLSPVVPLLGSATARFQPIDVGSVATAFVRALVVPEAVGTTLDLCGPDTLTLGEIVREILSATGRKRFTIRVPGWAGYAQARALELLFGRLLKRPPPLNRDQLIMLSEDNTGRPEAANQLFGLGPPRFREGIRAYLAAR